MKENLCSCDKGGHRVRSIENDDRVNGHREYWKKQRKEWLEAVREHSKSDNLTENDLDLMESFLISYNVVQIINDPEIVDQHNQNMLFVFNHFTKVKKYV